MNIKNIFLKLKIKKFFFSFSIIAFLMAGSFICHTLPTKATSLNLTYNTPLTTQLSEKNHNQTNGETNLCYFNEDNLRGDDLLILLGNKQLKQKLQTKNIPYFNSKVSLIFSDITGNNYFNFSKNLSKNQNSQLLTVIKLE